MNVNIYDSRSLSQAINNTKVTEPFIRNTLIGPDRLYPNGKVDFEFRDKTNRAAKHVRKNSGPKVVELGSQGVKSFNTFRTFESKVFSADEIEAMVSIGNIYGDRAAKDREVDRRIMEEVDELKLRILTTQEWMAAQLVSEGELTLDVEGQSETIDLGYQTDKHKETLGAGDKWTDATASILNQFRAVQKVQSQRGYKTDGVILGSLAADALLNNEDARKALDNNNLRVGSLDISKKSQANARYLGNLYGLDIWEYDQIFTKENGDTAPFIAQNKAVYYSNDFKKDTEMAFGPIVLFDENGKIRRINSQFHMDSKMDKYNKVLEWTCEHNSLPAIKSINGIYVATVVDAA